MFITKRNAKEIKYVFIDSQNLNLGTSKDLYKENRLIYKGWKLDFRKFRVYLKDKFSVNRCFLFIGYIKTNHHLYKKLEKYGYEIIFKETVRDEKGKLKGNIDADLVLKAIIEFDYYDKAIIVSGDGDFYCLYKFLVEKGKLGAIIIPNNKSESSLLKEFQEYKVYIWRNRRILERKWRA